MGMNQLERTCFRRFAACTLLSRIKIKRHEQVNYFLCVPIF